MENLQMKLEFYKYLINLLLINSLAKLEAEKPKVQPDSKFKLMTVICTKNVFLTTCWLFIQSVFHIAKQCRANIWKVKGKVSRVLGLGHTCVTKILWNNFGALFQYL